MPVDNSYDVIVAGVGSMGSAACYSLARRGLKVMGIEQFDRINEKGSHTGQSRIIRKAYYEHPDYVPLLQQAYDLWHQLESSAGIRLLYETGILYFGDRNSGVLKGIRRAADSYDVHLENFPVEEQKSFEFNAAIPPEIDSIFEPQAGFVLPHSTIITLSHLAEQAGATIRYRERILHWQKNDGHYSVTTDGGTYQCKKLIFTTGAWTNKLLPRFVELTVTEQLLAWYEPHVSKVYQLGNFPCWFIDDRELGLFYGFPDASAAIGPPAGIKIARHVPGKVTDPELRGPEADRADIDALKAFTSRYFPSLPSTPASTKRCLYTNSADENFIIDFLPGCNRDVIVACGFSGHGFKFVPVIGEIVSEMLITGHIQPEASFLSLNRFR